MRGVDRTLLENRYCIDVLTQVSAIHAALDGVALAVLDGHVGRCAKPEDERAEELMAAVARLMRRG